MATATANGPANKPAITLPSRPGLASVTTKSKALPNRVLLHAIQKWGKTSFAAMAPSPIFLCTRGEDGLDTLIKSGRLQETAHFKDTAKSWNHAMLALDELALQDHPYKTMVIDTVNGIEKLCIEHVIEKSFNGDAESFESYGRGMKPAFTPSEFQKLLTTLDVLREQRNMSIILLAHSQVKMFNNPEGLNYDRWEMVLAKETMAMLDRWVDMVLFGNFETFMEKAQKGANKTKATGGTQRLIHTERAAAFDAGNRYGLPSEIECGNSPQEAWTNFLTALHPNKK